MEGLLKTPPFSFFSFFQLSYPVRKLSEGKKMDASFSIHEPISSEFPLYIGWQSQGIKMQFHLPEKVFSEEGKSKIDIFFDTRDLKNSRRFLRFHHHFECSLYLSPYVEEITRFAEDDIHTLAHSEDLAVVLKKIQPLCELSLFFPASTLHGYDPEKFSKMGFAYILSFEDSEKHLFPPIEEFPLPRHPELWTTLEFSYGK